MPRFASASAGWAARWDGSGVRIGEDDVAGADGDELVLGRLGGSRLRLLDHGGVGQRDEVELALVQVVGQAAAIALGGQGELADDAMPVGLEDDAQVPFFHRRFVSDRPRSRLTAAPAGTGMVGWTRTRRLASSTAGTSPPATTSPPTSATSTIPPHRRCSGSATTGRPGSSTGASCSPSPTRPPTSSATTGYARATGSRSCCRR